MVSPVKVHYMRRVHGKHWQNHRPALGHHADGLNLRPLATLHCFRLMFAVDTA